MVTEQLLKKNSLWLLPFYMAVATYFYYGKVRRMMRTAIVSYLLNRFFRFYDYRYETMSTELSGNNTGTLETFLKSNHTFA